MAPDDETPEFCPNCGSLIRHGRHAALLIDLAVFDDERRMVGGHRLTNSQWAILVTLRRRPGALCTYDHIAASIWPNDVDAPEWEMRTIQVQICHLRHLLRDTPYHISTTWGKGYVLAHGRHPLGGVEHRMMRQGLHA